MNQRERMLSELPYKAWLDGLEEERKESRKRVYRYNNLPPEAENCLLYTSLPAWAMLEFPACIRSREIVSNWFREFRWK